MRSSLSSAVRVSPVRRFAAFYERHERGVLAYFARRVATPELAADLTAETFAQALASRRRFRPRGPGSGAGWLYGVAKHVLARSLRRGRVENRMRRLAMPPRRATRCRCSARMTFGASVRTMCASYAFGPTGWATCSCRGLRARQVRRAVSVPSRSRGGRRGQLLHDARHRRRTGAHDGDSAPAGRGWRTHGRGSRGAAATSAYPTRRSAP